MPIAGFSPPTVCVPCLRSYLHKTDNCPICGGELQDLWTFLESIEAVNGMPLNEFGEIEESSE